jgi:spore coat protein CotH
MSNYAFIKSIVFSTIALFYYKANAQNLYDVNAIQTIELNFAASNWDAIMDSLKNTSDDYYMANWVKINGIQYDSVGVRFKGNSSYNANSLKNPLHISLDKFKNQKHQGYEDIKLSNGYGDPSAIREVLGYTILKKYMHCPQANFAKVIINGNHYGCFTNDESIDKKFLGDHFYSNDSCFVKCSSSLSPSAASKNSFTYINADSTSYSSTYDMKSDTGWHPFIDLCNVVTSNTADLINKLDIDRAIWMLAFNNLFVNLDSYSGVYAQNHYIYQDHTGHFNPIIWDLNMCFGAFPFAGQGSIGMGQKSNSELKEYSPFAHTSDVAWPLINNVLANATWKRKYVAHLKTMLDENIINADYQTKATQFQTLINTDILNDTNKLFSYLQFQNGLIADVVFGGFTIPGIANLMEARKTYLQNLPEFTAVAPIISNYVSNPINPTYNSSFALTARVVNANSVYLGYRFDKTEKFIQLQMFDDGLHGDGSANDNIYGNNVTMQSGIMQYYIYAENANAGMFAPQRAEHEFYLVGGMQSQPIAGDIVINELLTDNVGQEKDEYGASEDWLELYNKSNKILNLSGCYLSDELGSLNKWTFPANTFINPNSYLTIWLDDDSNQQILHTNFNLSKDSGHVILSLPNQTMLDSVSYNAQTTNVSYGRFPNGTGNFMSMNRTFGKENNNYPLQILSSTLHHQCVVFPNPCTTSCTLRMKGEHRISVYSLSGKKIFSGSMQDQRTLNTNMWQKGLYIVRVDENAMKLMVD